MDNRSPKGLAKLIRAVRRHFWSWFIYIVSTSLIAIVVCSLIFDKNIELNTINNWVGVVLGLVALVATVFSLGLSFYNYDKQNELDKQNRELMQQVLNETKKTNDQLAKYSNSPSSVIQTESQKKETSHQDNLEDISNILNSLMKSRGDDDD